ncbi:M48 family metallopeptidase [Sulfidibacter corallicola]|uniref:M48 family metallopeptidase n=1 Tax=Sulfidibacter corallicola TaxID=2818388 RepID=A0A8A4TR21_SULCO|nr:M48 family metallopeptidase [Sulfidibacter corallicola]QTD51421.1 M48 family metallopeptidase [Sulfidibacter corallicola]
MKIEPRVPVTTADASRGSSTPRRLLVNTVLVIAFFVVSYQVLGWVSLGLVHLMPVQWEEKLAFSVPETWDEEAPPQVTRVFDRLITTADYPRPVRLYLIDSPDPNAFALPGGSIALTTALVTQSESEEELAFVIGHELGHLKHRDSMKKLSRSVVFGLSKALLFGENQALSSLHSIDTLAQMQHSRSQETRADRFSLELVLAAYGHVGGTTHFFEKMREDGEAGEWMRTHPLPQSRIDRMNRLIAIEEWQMLEATPLQ